MNKNDTGFFKDFKVAKYGKLFLLISLLIALAGVAVIAIFGFNLAYEYKGGYKITIEAEGNIRKDKAQYNEYKDSITGIIEGLTDDDGVEYGLKVTGVSSGKAESQGVEVTNLVFITTLHENGEPLTDDFLLDLSKALNAKNFKSSDGTKITVLVAGADFNAPAGFWDSFINPFGVVLLTAALTCVYFAFRYNLRKALTALYVLVSDVILLLALLAVLRVPFNVNIGVLIAVVMLQSLFALSFLFGRIKGNRVKPAYTGLSDNELINASFNEIFMRNLVAGGISLVAALALLIGTQSSLFLAAGAAIAVLLGFLNGVFAAPAVLALISGRMKEAAAKRPAPKAAKPRVETGEYEKKYTGAQEETAEPQAPIGEEEEEPAGTAEEDAPGTETEE